MEFIYKTNAAKALQRVREIGKERKSKRGREQERVREREKGRQKAHSTYHLQRCKLATAVARCAEARHN